MPNDSFSLRSELRVSKLCTSPGIQEELLVFTMGVQPSSAMAVRNSCPTQVAQDEGGADRRHHEVTEWTSSQRDNYFLSVRKGTRVQEPAKKGTAFWGSTKAGCTAHSQRGDGDQNSSPNPTRHLSPGSNTILGTGTLMIHAELNRQISVLLGFLDV